MRADIHPKYEIYKTICSCGAEYDIYTNKQPKIEICANCHPFYTGKQKLVDTAGRVEKFNKRFRKHAEPLTGDSSKEFKEK